MSDDGLDLWPADLFKSVQRTPRKLLNEQMSRLNARPGSVIEAEVQTVSRLQTSHEFWLHCPTLSRSTMLFSVNHSIGQVYPCDVNCVIWEPEDYPPQDGDGWKTAPGEDALIVVLREILGSGFVRSVVESMQAQALEVLEERGKPT